MIDRHRTPKDRERLQDENIQRARKSDPALWDLMDRVSRGELTPEEAVDEHKQLTTRKEGRT